MKIGFTGTQKGMTSSQYNTVRTILDSVPVEECAHGDCIGADAQFNRLCIEFDFPIIVHPPINPSKRAFCAAKNLHHRSKKPYLERNKNIVNECDLLIACPKTSKEETRSGTWSTVRYAKKMKKRVVIVYPSGIQSYF